MDKMVTLNHEDLVIRTFMLFLQLAIATTKYVDSRFYRAQKSSMIKYSALKFLVINGGIMKHSELARWTYTKKHNITTLVERMKEEKLVTTERNKKDKRIIEIRITDKGRETYKHATPVARSIVQELMRDMDTSDVRKFEKLLNSMKTNIERT
jgi:DNA-binding MarR family transcriptional regulator